MKGDRGETGPAGTQGISGAAGPPGPRIGGTAYVSWGNTSWHILLSWELNYSTLEEQLGHIILLEGGLTYYVCPTTQNISVLIVQVDLMAIYMERSLKPISII